jgi:phage protein D
MANEVVKMEDRDLMAPAYDLVLHGVKNAPPVIVTDEVKKYIEEIVYEESDNQFAHLEIKMNGQDFDQSGSEFLSLIDSQLFSEGTIVEVQMGYGQLLQTVGAADIVRRSPNYPENELPSMRVEGYELLHRTARRRPRGGVTYRGFRDSQIASIIGERNGFEIRTKDPKSYENIRKTGVPSDDTATQNRGTSDYEHLKKVAQKNGFDVFSRWDTKQKKFVLFFQPPAALVKMKEVFQFNYRANEEHFRNVPCG